MTGRTEPKFNSHITEKITQNFVLFPCHAHHKLFSAFLVFSIAFRPVRSKASQKRFRPLNRPLANSRSHRGHGCLTLVNAVCCEVEVSAAGWLLVQRNPTDYKRDREAWTMRRPWPTTGFCAIGDNEK